MVRVGGDLNLDGSKTRLELIRATMLALALAFPNPKVMVVVACSSLYWWISLVFLVEFLKQSSTCLYDAMWPGMPTVPKLDSALAVVSMS